MKDFEKNRIEYVQSLESRVQHQQRIIAELQAKEPWCPKLAVQMDGPVARIVMQVQGKNQTVEIPMDVAAQFSITDLTTAVLEKFNEGVLDLAFRPVIAEQLQPVTAAARTVTAPPIMSK